jgi:hypothetical protein
MKIVCGGLKVEKEGKTFEYKTLVNMGYVISILVLLLGVYFIKNGYTQGFAASIVPVIFGAYILSTGDKTASRYGWGLILIFVAYILTYIGYFVK